MGLPPVTNVRAIQFFGYAISPFQHSPAQINQNTKNRLSRLCITSIGFAKLNPPFTALCFSHNSLKQLLTRVCSYLKK